MMMLPTCQGSKLIAAQHVILKLCLGYTRSATFQLQGAHMDILTAIKEVDIMLTSLKMTRNLLNTYYNFWLEEACRIAKQIGGTIKLTNIFK